MTAPNQQRDPVTGWIAEANAEFFGQVRSAERSEVHKALVGFAAWAVGLAIILWQVLGRL